MHFSLAIIIGCFLGFLLNHFLFKLGKKLAVFWIARICAFCAAWQDKKIGTIQERIKLFANTIVDKLKQNENKQLIVKEQQKSDSQKKIVEKILKRILKTLKILLKLRN